MVQNANFFNMKKKRTGLPLGNIPVFCFLLQNAGGSDLVDFQPFPKFYKYTNMLENLENIYMNIKDNLFNEIEHFHDLNPNFTTGDPFY